MSQQPRLLPDGGVFPPVTPDPPPPPGHEDVVVPDLVPRSDAESEQSPSVEPTAGGPTDRSVVDRGMAQGCRPVSLASAAGARPPATVSTP